MFINLLKTLVTPNGNTKLGRDDNARKSPVKDVVNATWAKKDKLNNKKQDLVDAVFDVAEDAESDDEAWRMMNDDAYMKSLIAELEEKMMLWEALYEESV